MAKFELRPLEKVSFDFASKDTFFVDMKLMTDIDTSKPVFSSQVPDLNFSTQSSKIAVSIADVSAAMTIFSTTVYKFADAVTIYDIRDVIESHMLALGLSLCEFSLSVEGDLGDNSAYSLKVVFCSQNMLTDAASFCESHFLSTLTCKRLSRFVTERLYFCGSESSATISAMASVGGKKKLLSATSSGMIGNDSGVKFAVTSYARTAELIRESNPSEDFDEIFYWSVKIGRRVFTIYPSDVIPDWQFAFRNCFNAWEYASLSCVTTEKTNISKSEAHLSRSSVFYDFRAEKSYQVHTSPLMVDEARWLEQIAQARDVLLVMPQSDDFSKYPRLLVSEGDISFSDSDEDTASVTFEWKFADDRPHITYSTTYFKIFTEHFDKSYR